MGKTQSFIPGSSNEFGSIDILCSQEYFVSDDNISGTVELNLTKDFNILKLDVQLIGKEIVTIYKDKEETILVDQKIELKTAKLNSENNNQDSLLLPAKQHSFPFNFKVRDKLPSRFSYKSKVLDCKIYYSLIATLTAFNNPMQDLKKVQDISVVEKLNAYPNKSINKVTKITSADQTFGTAKMNSRIDFTAIAIPLGFELIIDYDNADCLKSVKVISIRMIEKITARVKKARVPYIEEHDIAQWELSGITKGEKAFYDSRLSFPESGKMNLHESVNGKYFKREYSIFIDPVYDMWSCTGKPTASFNVALTNYDKGRSKEEVKKDINKEELKPIEEEKAVELRPSEDIKNDMEPNAIPPEKVEQENK